MQFVAKSIIREDGIALEDVGLIVIKHKRRGYFVFPK